MEDIDFVSECFRHFASPVKVHPAISVYVYFTIYFVKNCTICVKFAMNSIETGLDSLYNGLTSGCDDPEIVSWSLDLIPILRAP